MTKADLAEAVARATELSKKDSEVIVETVLTYIIGAYFTEFFTEMDI